jgi:hypothetical protein
LSFSFPPSFALFLSSLFRDREIPRGGESFHARLLGMSILVIHREAALLFQSDVQEEGTHGDEEAVVNENA